MKRMHIPQGVTKRHENIFADTITLSGRLIVTGIIRANKIYGSGTIEAKRISAGTIVADTIDANHICATKMIANKVICLTAVASMGIIAKDYIEAQCVKTERLIAAQSLIDRTEASEIIRLKPKRSFAAALFCSWFAERFMFRRHTRIAKKKVDASATTTEPRIVSDSEFERIVGGYREKYRKGGYRLVLEAIAEPDVV